MGSEHSRHSSGCSYYAVVPSRWHQTSSAQPSKAAASHILATPLPAGACVHEGDLYLVTELMQGGDLWTALHSGRITWYNRWAGSGWLAYKELGCTIAWASRQRNADLQCVSLVLHAWHCLPSAGATRSRWTWRAGWPTCTSTASSTWWGLLRAWFGLQVHACGQWCGSNTLLARLHGLTCSSLLSLPAGPEEPGVCRCAQRSMAQHVVWLAWVLRTACPACKVCLREPCLHQSLHQRLPCSRH